VKNQVKFLTRFAGLLTCGRNNFPNFITKLSINNLIMSDYIENPIRVNNQLISGAKVDVVDLCYSVALNGKMKRLLTNVSFNLDSGNLCALMGPSGAGKR
jgi:ABC-type multidrug transport system fused ATPase/permease subunit